jgi:predicted adenine nucleotide alpha hydrolase (AANH) superfamily ATPase
MKIVLHICCGVCAAGVVEKLKSEGNLVTGLFYNPNIHPQEEYEKRLEAARKVSAELDFPLVAGHYKPEEWFEKTASMENEPEGGKRCESCYRLRLKETYLYSQKQGADAFATTLTVSPHKPANVVNRVGWDIGRDMFLARDFKKQAGFQRSIELAKKWSLYRQDYCGCLYSIRYNQTS